MKYVFVTGMGRSGTKFLSSLLSLDENIISKHEYIGNREYWLLSWYLGGFYSKSILESNKREIEKKFNTNMFIDVNGYLSDSTEMLNEVFTNSKIFHLVRNPKSVVPSIMIRRDDNRIHKIPKDKTGVDSWQKMSKLEQVCLNWVQTTEDLLKSNTDLLIFEKLVSDYSYFREKILNPLKIRISRNQYESFVSKKINRTRSWLYRFLYAKYKGKPMINKKITFRDLSTKENQMFLSICHDTMVKLGYE